MPGTAMTRRARSVLALLPTALLLLVPQAGFCQEPDDFLFAAPRFSFGIRAGYSLSIAESEIHDFFTEQFAWIPMAVVPYLGAGLGVTYFEFKQQGDLGGYTSGGASSSPRAKPRD